MSLPLRTRPLVLFRGVAGAGLVALAVMAATAPGAPPAGVTAAAPGSTAATPVAPSPAGASGGIFQGAERDAVAARYLNSCAGCHSLTGLKLNGPELSPVAGWPVEQLRVAIRKMEPRVGSLTGADVDSLAALLQSPNVRERLAAESLKIRAQFEATAEPGNAATGAALFSGRLPLRNGGMACAPCHRVGTQGGQLGPDLSGAHARLGEAPLRSGIENASYRVMAAHYRTRPVTPQEAIHLVTYLATVGTAPPSPPARSVLLPGLALALAGLLGTVVYGRRGRSGRRATPRKDG